MYILEKTSKNILYGVFFIDIIISLMMINLDTYDEVLFELYLWLNILEELPYINSEIIYALLAIHILLFLNLKKFEKLWAIIDKKLVRKF